MSYFKAKMHQNDLGWGSAPYPAGGAYSAPPDPLAIFKGLLLKGREGKIDTFIYIVPISRKESLGGVRE